MAGDGERLSGRKAAVDQAQQRAGDLVWGGRAARDEQVDGQDGADGTGEVRGGADNVAAKGAVAECGDFAGLRHGVISGQQRLAHPRGDGAGDEQDVGVPGRGDDAEAVSLQVVMWSGGEGEFVFATVSRAGVDMPDGQAPGPVGAWQGEVAAQAAQVAQQGEHQRSAQA